jgi:hypothetical protein
MLKALLLFAALPAFCSVSFGQADAPVSRGVFQVGVGATAARPDFATNYIVGLTGYASYDTGSHGGVIVEAHVVNLYTPQDVGENSFLLGFRYGITKSRFHPYAKLLTGVGALQLQRGYQAGSSTAYYEVFAAGGGVDLIAPHKINVRLFDFEYQGWPGVRPNGLTPMLMTVGVARRF